jgi:Ca-activated chloride channel family protein
MKQIFLLVLFCMCAVGAAAQTDSRSLHKLRRDADRAWKQGKYESAELDYRRALFKEPESAEIKYNLANTLQRNNKIAEAIPYYEEAAQSEDAGVAARSFYNLGQIKYDAGDYTASVEAYKQVLKRFSDDRDAKHNLALALQQIKKQQPPPPPQGDPPPQESPKKNDKAPQPTEPQKTPDGPQQEAVPPKQEPLDKRRMEQLMRELNAQDADVRKKLRRRQEQTNNKRDW